MTSFWQYVAMRPCMHACVCVLAAVGAHRVGLRLRVRARRPYTARWRCLYVCRCAAAVPIARLRRGYMAAGGRELRCDDGRGRLGFFRRPGVQRRARTLGDVNPQAKLRLVHRRLLSRAVSRELFHMYGKAQVYASMVAVL